MKIRSRISRCNNNINKPALSLPLHIVHRKQKNTGHQLEQHRVSDWMQTGIVTITPELHVEQAWERLTQHKVQYLPVIQDDIIVGIVTERALKRALFGTHPMNAAFVDVSLSPGNPGAHPIAAIMTPCVSIAAPSENLQAVAQRMFQKRMAILPVVSGSGKLLGILTLSDILRAMLFDSDECATTATLSQAWPATKGVSVWVT